MAFIEFFPRRSQLSPFSGAVIATGSCLCGFFVLASVAWHYPFLRLPAVAYCAVLACALFYQLRRIHRVWVSARETVFATQDDPLARALSELIRTFQWGSAMVMLVSLGVLMAYSCLR